jgi:hypothetical protein
VVQLKRILMEPLINWKYESEGADPVTGAAGNAGSLDSPLTEWIAEMRTGCRRACTCMCCVTHD